jgi:hypothetical protein
MGAASYFSLLEPKPNPSATNNYLCTLLSNKLFGDSYPRLKSGAFSPRCCNLDSYKKFRDKAISMYLDFRVFKDKLKLQEKYIKSLTRESSGEKS